jgi:hypothetical protein
MKPLSFDPVTAREMVGDDRARVIEKLAREHADQGEDAFAPPRAASAPSSPWAAYQEEFEAVVYREQFGRRLARNARKGVVG